jgi:hypothetical protein
VARWQTFSGTCPIYIFSDTIDSKTIKDINFKHNLIYSLHVFMVTPWFKGKCKKMRPKETQETVSKQFIAHYLAKRFK